MNRWTGMPQVKQNRRAGQSVAESLVTADTDHKNVRSTLWWRSLLVMTLGLGLIWIYITRVPPATTYLNETVVAPLVGRIAPDFVLKATDGRSFKLSALRGTPVVINFWATWCPPCRKEMPELEKLWLDYGVDGELMLLGVDQAEDKATIEQFRRSVMAVTFPILLDRTTEVADLYNVQALPTTFFIAADGRIQDVKIGGPMDRAVLMDGVNKVMVR